MTSTLANGLACELCVDTMEGVVKPSKEIYFFDQVDFVKSFCYLGNRLNASGGSEAAVTARTRIGWIESVEKWGVTIWEKVFVKNEWKDLSELRKISIAIWERYMMSKREGVGNFEKN